MAPRRGASSSALVLALATVLLGLISGASAGQTRSQEQRGPSTLRDHEYGGYGGYGYSSYQPECYTAAIYNPCADSVISDLYSTPMTPLDETLRTCNAQQQILTTCLPSECPPPCTVACTLCVSGFVSRGRTNAARYRGRIVL